MAIDFQALTLAGVACLLPPLQQLNRHKAEPVSSVPTFILLSFMAMLAATVQVLDLVVLETQPWFTGGTGTASSVSTPPPSLPPLAVSSCMTGSVTVET